MEQSEEVRFIVNQAKVLLGRELNGSDVATIVAIFDWAGVSPDIILMAMEYCSSCGKTDMRSVERQCTYWYDHGITTHEMVDDYIKEKAAQNAHQGLIKSAFGISGRNLSSKECDFIKHWFDELNFDITMIKLAFDKTVDNTGKITFSYLNKILENWHSKGILTPMQAESEGAKSKPKRQPKLLMIYLPTITKASTIHLNYSEVHNELFSRNLQQG